MILILIVPVFVAAAISFTDYSLGNSDAAWVGWENYDRIVSRSTYTKMLIATGTYVGLVVPISIALGLGAALLINSVTRFGDLYKTIYFLPVMAALLAMAIVWEFSLHPSLGAVNKTLASGCEAWPEYFFSWGWLPGTEPEKSWYAIGCRDGFPLWFGDKTYTMWTCLLYTSPSPRD